MGVESCKPKPFIHPCDPPPECVPGAPQRERCPKVALCLEKIKNPAPIAIRCPNPHDAYSQSLCENAGLWQNPPICDNDNVQKCETSVKNTNDPCVTPKKEDKKQKDKVIKKC
ncbi:uncharacterized protein LOC113238776 [Hyposmocoma kahamanoa]|uniref:uncharacterized protein LOC113238776 n=1 Tax=Hyposmocoma kahamanoa TaxID=1477025 RepID=UPI000E6D93FC|nr:uncharacterized protein LOC113238776 [Hyposmocoma kahamanoa]